MPYAPARICKCGRRVPSGQRCACQIEGDRRRKAAFDAKRPTAAQRGYDGKWGAYRKRFLSENPWCERCLVDGRHTPASVVNHRIAHKGDKRLFWLASNHEPACDYHHNVVIQSEERRGLK